MTARPHNTKPPSNALSAAAMLQQQIPSLLVANRGEIAVRIFRTCRKLGIKTIAVYSDADRFARHVREADSAIRLGTAEAGASYLNVLALIEAVRTSKAAAVHPGYGFLSENGVFASEIEKAGARFLGPTQEQMTALGDKSNAKERAKSLGIPLLESFPVTSNTQPTPPPGMGFPVLFKANAGGGGRGMRIVREPSEFASAATAASREALAFFGDGTVFVERFIERARHVEVQLLGDGTGDIVAVGDRDCTVQRRYQKVIEEAPAFGLSAELRKRIWDDAIRLLASVKYRGAGTAEFLVTPSGEYFFLEINTRLQVEHPVTEAVTKLDLVELMIRIAAGEKLGSLLPETTRKALLSIEKTAIELRLCAEKPHDGFTPATGVIAAVQLPAKARVDSGVEALDRITHYYDSLIAKIIVIGENRLAALAAARAAIAKPIVLGIETNQYFLSQILNSPAYISGEHHTRWVDSEPTLTAPPPSPGKALSHCPSSKQGEPPFRVGFPAPAPTVFFESEGNQIPVTIPAAQHPHMIVSGRGSFMLTGGRGYPALYRAPMLRSANRTSAATGANAGSAVVAITTPLPGKILEVLITPGTSVFEGQVLLTFESMKMEHPVKASRSGVIKQICVKPQQVVEAGTVVIELAGS